MSLKVIGAFLVIAGCSGLGFRMASLHIREESVLRELIFVLDFMECELQYRMTPLPELCRRCAAQCKGCLQNVFLQLSKELEAQISPNVGTCVSVAIAGVKNLPQHSANMLDMLGCCLGQFDIEGQLRGIENVRAEVKRNLGLLCENKDQRLRSYQTIGLCAGAALAILLI